MRVSRERGGHCGAAHRGGDTRRRGRTDHQRGDLTDAVRVMTMHRAKGLGYRAAVRDASALRTRDDRHDRNLVTVSPPRARERLLVC